jgi:galactokinase
VAPRRVTAFAPGRVNVIGEHTDYNEGLALPFAIEQGVTVRAVAAPAEDAAGERIEALALDLDGRDSFLLREPGRVEGWRAFVRGAVAELTAAGAMPPGARLEISGDVPRGGGLSSSAAMTVALCLSLLELQADGAGADDLRSHPLALARLCSRVENEWTGARTGLLDQIASLYGAREAALLIDFRSLVVEQVPLDMGGWRFAVADSGERHSHASSGYNERREECAQACALLGVASLRDVRPDQLAELPAPLADRARHVVEENARVLAATRALRDGDMPALARLLSASHASLRDLYAISTPAVEATVERMLSAGAAGARLIGGGFGGSVLGLFDPHTPLPNGAIAVAPGPGAYAEPS